MDIAASTLFLLAIGLPLIVAILMPIIVTIFRENSAWFACLASVVSAVGLIAVATMVDVGPVVVAIPWVPTLGVSLSFLVDGLSLFFGLVVTVMGAFVLIYARHYLVESIADIRRFYTYILLFMSAMLGAVFANNLIVLFVCWELTSIVSFLLIGFYHADKGAQRGALISLLITGGTGLLMLVGLLILGIFSGSLDLSTMLFEQPLNPAFQPLLWVPLVFVAIGAAGKSAQFPFQFWLPNAMSAPTPISAYLHSAAMVKLGVFLLARLYPVLSMSDAWVPIVAGMGLASMVIGAVLAIQSHQLKAILAYTTVSQLGYLVTVYGLGAYTGISYDFFHILNHVLYKGTLFMVVGIVIHATHRKDIREIGGLANVMPWACVACCLASASMAGVIGTTGFLSKELLLEQLFYLKQVAPFWSMLGIISMVTAATCLVVVAIRLPVHLFFRRAPQSMAIATIPTRWFQLPPFVLSLGIVIGGLCPSIIERGTSWLYTAGLHVAKVPHLALFHGVTPPLLTSLMITALGVGLYGLYQWSRWRFAIVPKVCQLDRGFDGLLRGIQWVGRQVLVGLRLDQPVDYVPVVLTTIVMALTAGLCFLYQREGLPFFYWESPTVLIGTVSVIIAGSAIAVAVCRRWMAKWLALSALGIGMTVYFVLYRAPDLVLTQVLIEVVSMILVLALLRYYPRHAETEITVSHIGWRMGRLVVSVGLGSVMAVLVWVSTASAPLVSIRSYILNKTHALAGGANAVNTTLVDFRGFDTMGETTVLGIAMLGVMGLLMCCRKKTEKTS